MTTPRLLLTIALIFLFFLVWEGCNQYDYRNNLLEQVSKYELSEQQFKIKVNKDSSTIATQNQTIMTEREANKLGILKLQGEIKIAQSQVRQTQEIIYEGVQVPYIPNNYTDTSGWYAKLKSGDSSKSNIDSLISNSIIVPSKFELKQKWFAINGEVKKDGVLINKLLISNESTVTIGYKKTGFLWLGRKAIVEIENTNPYLKNTKISNVVIEKNKSLFKKPLFWAIVGGVASHLIIK
jgi:hypothetical protein